jgi:hypothetical protein
VDKDAAPAPGSATDRLEAALERIGRAATTGIIRASRSDAPADEVGIPPEAVERLDELIHRLRAALDDHDAS